MALNKQRIFTAADNYIRKNKIDKAIAEYETWLKENPKDYNTVRIVGDLYARISRNDEAIKKYAQVADHYRKDGFNVRAIATHKMVLRLDPQNEPAMRNLAELQAEEGLLMEAKSYYQTLVEIYNKQGHKRLAAEVFKKLAEIDPGDLKIHYKYAEFLNKNGKPDEAAREYVGIADQLIGQGKVDEAIKILEQGRSLHTSDPALKIKLAQASSLQGNHGQAIRMLEEVRRTASGDPTILARLGEAYLAAGNTDEAQAVFQDLSAAQPGNPDNVLRLADLRIAQSKFDTAYDELNPLIDKHVGSGEGAKAAELLSRILSKEPYHVKSLLKLAEIHTVLKQDPARITAYDSLCEAYSRTGDFDKAVAVAEQLVEFDPESSQHKDRLRFLKSKLAGGRAPAPAPPPARPAPAAAPAPPRAAAPSPPPRPAPPPARVEPDPDSLPDFSAFSDDLGEAVSNSFTDLGLDEAAPAPAAFAPAPATELGELVELTQEDEENIKEKLTEAEVFVRYGLVDKAIGQLVDVLESFRFHTETREKLIEIYKDHGMNREAGDQLATLSVVYERVGRASEAGAARAEASQLNPALAAEAARVDLVAEEEIELTLAPETESDLGDVGIEIDVPPMDEILTISESGMESEGEIPLSFEETPFEEPEIEISLGEESEAASPEVPEAMDVEVDWSAAEDIGDVSESPVSEVVADDELPVAVEEDFAALESPVEDLPMESAESEEMEIDLGTSSADIPFSIEEGPEEEVAALGSASDAVVSVPDEVFEVSASAASSSEAVEALDDEEFSVDIAESDGEISIDVPEPEEVSDSEETFAPTFDAASEDDAGFELDIEGTDDVQIDMSEVEDVVSDFGMKSEPTVEAVEPPKVAEPPKAVEPPRAPRPSPAPPPPQPAPKAIPASQPVVQAPPPRAAASPLAAELAEVDEYIALGLYEDARDTLRELLKQHPGQADVLAKIEELGFSSEQVQKEAKEPGRLLKTSPPTSAPAPAPAAPAAPPRARELPTEEMTEGSLEEELAAIESLVDDAEPEPFEAPVQAQAPAAPEGEFIDLASELSEEIFGTHSAIDDEEPEPEGPLTDPGLDQIFREFRKGVEKQLGAEDYDTRYNLGIAYKEMGLLDEAIAEFQLAAKDEVRSLECCSMLGLCFMEKGMPDIAIKWFSKGLAIPGRREEEYHGLRYDLAQAFEAANQPERALELYMEIFRENIKFRDVQERVKELQAARK
jgi:tetratricopeptide (TPR) repeat protein